MTKISLAERIQSFQMLCQQITKTGVSAEIIAQAIDANSWFTAYYIQKSLAGILSWGEELAPFLQQYSLSDKDSFPPKKIGIIAAGNVPFVCMHDILMVIFSGNIAAVKFSHQDNILTKWICEKWIQILPKLANFLHFVSSINECDFLIATGSDNTANALNYHFERIPKLIRKHRFSLAIVKNDISMQKLTSLCEDILLHNGLGCRNVSQLFLPYDFPLQKLEQVLNEYPISLLSENYLQKRSESHARLKMLGEEFIATKSILIQKQVDIKFSYLGILNVILYENEAEITQKIATIQAQIQCLVGQNVEFGQAQSPFLNDFADGIDTMALLLKLNQ